MAVREALMIASASAAFGAAEAAPAQAEAMHQTGAIEAQQTQNQMTFAQFAAKEQTRSATPVAQAAEFHWDHVGGAPFDANGVNTKKEAAHALHSGKGHKAMYKEGLNSAQVKALDKAAGKNGEGMKDCTILPNVHYPVMISKNYDKANDVVLNAESYPDGIPAFCVTAVRKYKKNGKTYTETVTQAQAKTCDNFVLMNKKTTSKTVAKPTHKPTKALVDVYKNALTANDTPLKEVPTGTFQFEVKCRQNGKNLTRLVVMNRNPQPLASCDTGKAVTVSEKDTLGTDKWETLSPVVQTQTAKLLTIAGKKEKGNRFTFKDRQVAAPETPAINICSGDTTNTSTNNSGNTIQQGNCSVVNLPPQPPVTPPTPPEKPPVTPNLSLNHIQEVDTGTTNVVRATITNATIGHKLLTCFDADYGKFEEKCIEVVADSNTEYVDDTYTASTEAGLTETITATTLDETTNIFANPNPFTESFPIQSGDPVTGRP